MIIGQMRYKTNTKIEYVRTPSKRWKVTNVSQLITQYIIMITKSTEAEVDEAIRLVQQAKYDNKIWKSGLDISYKTFLANKPSPTMKSVLLSIL